MKKQVFRIKWVVDHYRTDKRTGALNPIKRSKWADYLFNKGMGWKDE